MPTRFRGLLPFALAVGGAAALAAQAPRSSAPWFGLALPPGIGDPHRPVVNVATVTTPPARVPAGEEGFTELKGDRIRRDVETIVGFSKQSRAAGDQAWGRVTGFPAAARTMAWVAEQFKEAGVSGVEVQEYDASAPMWWSRSWEARLVGDAKFGAGSRDVVLESAVPTSGSLIPSGSSGGTLGTLSAPIVYVGPASNEALPDVDVKGKVAVQHLKPASGAYSERGATVRRAQELMKRGAVAVINVVEQVGNMHVRDFGNCGGPCFNLGGADGAFVEAAIERAARAGVSDALRVQLRLEAQTMAGLKGHNAIGVIPGKQVESEEVIIVNAHADGWFDAAGDNGDGLAVLVALARHFSKPQNRLERTLMFVSSGGHHSTGLNGPANVVRMNPGLMGKALLVLNLEHIAQLYIRPEPWRVEPTEQPMGFGISNEAPFLKALATRGVERYGFRLNPTFSSGVPGDLGGYAPLGVARVQAIHSGPMYHTSGDVAETISAPGLERAARFYAYFVGEVSKASKVDLNPPKP